MSYAVRVDGVYGWRAVHGPEDCLPNEAWQTEPCVPYVEPPPAPAEQVAVLFEQYDKDRGQFERYLGDAVNLYADEGYASEMRTQITALDDEYIASVGVILNG